MRDDVKKCIEMRTDFFEKYYSVPDAVRGEVDDFIAEVNVLGESCGDAMEFEGKFAAQGLSEKFNALLVKCTPCPQEMSKEEKQNAKQVAKEMFKENKKQILKDVALDIADSVAMKAESELIEHNRQEMIKEGVYDEYTKVTNAVEDTTKIGGFLFKKFRKK